MTDMFTWSEDIYLLRLRLKLFFSSFLGIREKISISFMGFLGFFFVVVVVRLDEICSL